MIIERRSTPIKTLSLALSKSDISTSFLFWRAASNAASFTRFARSAPEKPGVPRASVLSSTLGASGIRRACTRRISSGEPCKRFVSGSCRDHVAGGDADCGRTEPREPLIVEDNGQQRGVDLDVSVVFDEPEIAELVHEKVDARAGRAHHLGKRLL